MIPLTHILAQWLLSLHLRLACDKICIKRFQDQPWVTYSCVIFLHCLSDWLDNCNIPVLAITYNMSRSWQFWSSLPWLWVLQSTHHKNGLQPYGVCYQVKDLTAKNWSNKDLVKLSDSEITYILAWVEITFWCSLSLVFHPLYDSGLTDLVLSNLWHLVTSAQRQGLCWASLNLFSLYWESYLHYEHLLEHWFVFGVFNALSNAVNTLLLGGV
jgi:hypothetical protein